MLNDKQQVYFNNIVNDIKNKLSIDIEIVSYNHKDLPQISQKTAIGLIWEIDKEVKMYKITIDETYIKKCWDYMIEIEEIKKTRYIPNQNINKDIIETICHEIAHIKEWEHGKNHDRLTKELLKKVL